MFNPQLTIGIPTLDRHRFLRRAIDSCFRQTAPVHVIVADQGGLPETRAIFSDYYVRGHSIQHVRTKATNLWENWEAAARACDTPFFSWLQDDDIVATSVQRPDGSLIPGTGYAHRVLAAFERFPDALHWQGRYQCGICPPDGGVDDVMMAWWGQGGPWVHMPTNTQAPLQWPGQIIAPVSYLTSWTLSPAVAFRCGAAFTRMLDFMPPDCGLNYERLTVSAMGLQGPWIADPVIAGYWIHHGANESYNQHVDQDRQKQVMVEFLDEILDNSEWQDLFAQWCLAMNPMQILGFLNGFDCEASRHAEQLKRIMGRSLQGRVEGVAPAPAQPTGESDLLWSSTDLDTMRVAS